jgi:hypothetical protein
MKKYLPIILLLSTFSVTFFSCRDNQSRLYGDQLKDEKQKINDYINRHNIDVVTVFPDNDKWEENLYVQTNSGLYFHLVDSGKGDTIQINDLINLRYIKHTLDENPDTLVNMMSTIKYPYPYVFRYSSGTDIPTSWSEAILYMKRSGSEAVFIAPSKIGMNAELNSVTPMCYRFKITVQK